MPSDSPSTARIRAPRKRANACWNPSAIVFNSLTREHLARIVDIQLTNVGKLLKDRNLKLEITTAAKDRIITEGYDPQYGARPMKRAIQRLIQDPLALKLITGGFVEGDTILVDAAAEPEQLSFSKLVPAPVAPENAEARK
jgi:ATP-dependent Clp protease ATP-binding subunit ClpB